MRNHDEPETKSGDERELNTKLNELMAAKTSTTAGVVSDFLSKSDSALEAAALCHGGDVT